ncbi:MAG: hypothetical protein V7K48_21165 [Nostoc sp.]|uniref:hypothetical protein n=1 Tax=Nostoc sp. TaxID=1180 RepID=UPI002FF72345
MKKLIAALVAIPTIALAKVGVLANVGEDVINFFATHENDLTTLVRSLANQGDDAASAARSLANQGDDAAIVARGLANQGDDVAKVAPGVFNLNQAKANAKQVIYNEVHNAILSGVNKDSINHLMAVAEEVNKKQYSKTGVLLSGAALLTLVNQAQALAANVTTKH